MAVPELSRCPLLASCASHPFPQRHRSQAYGPSLRSTDSGLRVTIFGAYGFVGKYLTQLLGASREETPPPCVGVYQSITCVPPRPPRSLPCFPSCLTAAGDGTRCVIPFRGDDMEWRDLRVMGDYGLVLPVPFSPRDDASIRSAIRNSDVVINLAGKDYETTHFAPNLVNFSFRDVNVGLAEKIARISVEEVRARACVFVFMHVRGPGCAGAQFACARRAVCLRVLHVCHCVLLPSPPQGVANLVHVSALAANKYSISNWAKSKVRLACVFV